MGTINWSLDEIMKRRGIPNAELARRLGKHRNTVSNMRNDARKVDLKTIEKLCNILEVTPHELLGWKE